MHTRTHPADLTGRGTETRRLRFATLVFLLLVSRGAAALGGPTRMDYDSWTATDGLGRTLPTYRDVGPRRPGKFVGMFYFLWLGQHGNNGPYDITRILAKDPLAMEHPESPLWGAPGLPHHWGESVFGYYVSEDEWVLRKHAQLLSAAGVDTVIFDTTNQLTYPRSYLALCRVWSKIRKEGGTTPQIAFLTPFGDPTSVVQALYEDFYSPGLYSDLWFRWDGKPLILADPGLISPERMTRFQRVPVMLPDGSSLGQSFTADRSFTAVGGEFPTWATPHSSVTLTLRRDGPEGRMLVSQRFQNVVDNALAELRFGRPLAPGHYYLEISKPEGQVGWWSITGDVYPGGRAFADGAPAPGDRSLFIHYAGDAAPLALVSDAPGDGSKPRADAAKLNRQIHDFFTFRKPQPDYFVGPTGPAQWGWLEVYPQHAFYKVPAVPEQVTVGVAQNSVDGKLSVLSNPRSHGRSFHDGAEPAAREQDFTGRNFAEQWKRALQIDPSFVFVTGWNEWIAGRFGTDSPFYGSSLVNFVDEFNHEFSRDIEPVVGGHLDAYYYQLVSNVRRFKGLRPPPSRSTPRTIPINGDFRAWRNVRPEYRDPPFDTVPRKERGWGRGSVYVNTTGRNDFVLLKVAHDARNIYFYARTRQWISSFRDPDWMLLLINTGLQEAPSWQGFQYIINRSVSGARTSLVERSTGGWNWERAARIRYRVEGNELELSVPRRAVGLADSSRPLEFDFKWMDNVDAEHDILNLYRNGDTAPDGRFRYHYRGMP